MTNDAREMICSAAVDYFGEEAQTLKAIEEMTELTQALCKHLNRESESDYAAIAEEMADVGIMIDQLRLIFSNRNVVEEIADYKLRRLAKRIDVGEILKDYAN